MKSIIICGNGMYKPGTGKVIDNFDIVIRVNDFQTDGFEDLVGRKIDIWSMGGTIKWFRCQCPIVWNCYSMYHYFGETHKIQKGLLDRLKIRPFEIVEKLSKELDMIHFPHPRTGLITIMNALKEFGPPIHIVGFGDDSVNQPHYYWHNHPNQKQQIHNNKKEYDYIENLIKEDKVIRFKIEE